MEVGLHLDLPSVSGLVGQAQDVQGFRDPPVERLPKVDPSQNPWSKLSRPEIAREREAGRLTLDPFDPGQVRGARIEHSDFKDEHIVECYVVKDGVVVARDRINVPIGNTSV
ncbi:hypothetical protein [Streptomyces sp. NPDC005732]|uniref:nucleotide-binding domain-containing protein n=1 Tax=Streptomyces sp. NPDC005732 TaxID=3157057 RepID=UPI0033EFA94D